MLTIQKKDSILFQPCDTDNRSIIYTEDSIIDNTGQECLRCKIIKEVLKKGNRTCIFLEKGCSYSDTISYERIKDNLVHWYLYNGVNFLSTNKSEKYKIIEQPCIECRSKKECDKVDNTNININGNWLYSCNSSASINITDENNTLLAVMSNQIYIKVKLKKIKKNKFELFLIEPEDLGPGGMNMKWENFSRDKAIANIDLLENGTIQFFWIGFYDEKENEIVFPKCEFNLEFDGINPVILKRCQ